MKSLKKLLFFSFMLNIITVVSPVGADVRLPSMIGDNMLIQRDMDITLRGWADPGERVKITFAGENVTVKADRKGTWKTTLSPMNAGGPYEIIFKGKNTIRVENVLIGELWLCSGQSNMEMYVQAAADPHNEIAHAYHPEIRLFNVDNEVGFVPADDCVGQWKVCSPYNVPQFSAAAYYFGRALQDSLGVPVGLINASWGGTPAEVWMRPESIASNPVLKPLYDKWKPVLDEKSPEIVRYYHELGIWHDNIYYMMNTGEPLDIFNSFGYSGIKVPDTKGLVFAPNVPGICYHSMVAPFTDFAIRGAIWYQGESNAGRAYEYRTLFPALIEDWRALWGREIPFVFVQLTAFGTNDPSISESSWAELREAQLMTLDLPATAMAVTIDIGDTKDIHPKNKQEVGRRLALGALKAAYDCDIAYSGPVFKTMLKSNKGIHLRFLHDEGGLATSDGNLPYGFIVAGKDGTFVPASAEIVGNEVVVSSHKVPDPVAVRYGWAGDPACNLVNGAGLPASPFRTDDWPGITAPK